MSRLIDADELILHMCASCSTESCDGYGKDSMAKCFTIQMIEEQPIAFDEDKVVEQLKINAEDYFYESRSGKFVARDAIGVDKAIEIVKKGGR